MKIWCLKSSSNMYFEFKVKFGVILKVNFGKIIYLFESWEVRNNTLNIMQIGVETRKFCAFEANWSKRTTKFEIGNLL